MSDPADAHPLWLGSTPLVLASGSRTRFDLLTAAGIPVEVVRPHVDERAISDPLEARGERPGRVAAALALAKARSVASAQPGRHVLGADQVLACAGRFLHKPRDSEQAADQLGALAGRDHELFSAVAIVRDGATAAAFVVRARLTMRALSPGMIARYLAAAGDGVRDSVGGYQLERVGIHLFRRITGEHSVILGLPMLQTLARLRRLGLVAE